jgi:dihydropteridine reductase
MSRAKKVLCFGGAGALGTKVLKNLSGYPLTSIDFKEPSGLQGLTNILLKKEDKPKQSLTNIKAALGKTKFDAIIVTAGGWKGGNIKSETFFEDYELMKSMNLVPALMAGHLAATHLTDGGLLVFTGAAAVFKEPQPEMIGYAMAKTGVHSFALNLAESNTLPPDTSVITILPEIIDTPANREAMPNANFDEWASPNQIGELLKGWVDGLNRPSTGSFVVLKVKNKSIVPEFV